MKMTEKLQIHWESFSDQSRQIISELYHTQKFSDVTLICEDQEQFRVHKFLVSASSSVFKNILDSDINHSTIYLRGITKADLEPILQFIYLGEASICKSNLDSFFEVAKDLDVNEIGKTNSDADTEDQEHNESEIVKKEDYEKIKDLDEYEHGNDIPE